MQRIPPVLIAGSAALLQRVLSRKSRGTRGSKIAAGAVAAGSLGVLGASGMAFIRHGTSVDPMELDKAKVLVRTGVYRSSRNPMYVSLAGFLLAHAIARRSWPALAPIAMFVAVLDQTQIPAEEEVLRARFGEDYERFARQVPRWLGIPVRP